MVQAGRVVFLPFLADLIHENGLFWPLLDNLVNCLRVYITFKPTNPEHLNISVMFIVLRPITAKIRARQLNIKPQTN